MDKDTPDEMAEYWQAASFYGREFLRADKQFQKENQSLYALENKIRVCKTKKEKYIAEKKFKIAKETLIGKWGLNFRYRPIFADWNYYACLSSGSSPFAPATDPFAWHGEKFEGIEKRKLEHLHAYKFRPENAQMRSSSGEIFNPQKVKRLTVTIDFEKPKDQILHELSKLIDTIRVAKGQKENTRLRLEHYADYLKALNCIKSGMSFRATADFLYPGKTYGLKRVKDHYKAITLLIAQACNK